ncbi:RIP metalloprotease RseP [Paenimyroides tangerinum]|uniref:Zinc metalloprotease n=1 Tax=Paenimyroides tangerinum TaxID=2488728 RepID=A0A3P3W974_9FLAO|nr:RIP metalloprotease RseP [Paenimyroides tangerinum]RRJ90546.1 RIP metalloprotease RseP [Paenimyroides tangerinum]
MDIVIKLSQFLLSLSLLIVLHELGHFIPAKLFKTRVEKFYLFFDVKFSLFKKKIGDTVYGIGWLPLGGYVKIAGMIDESMDTEQMKQEPQPWEFRSKPAWQRLIIMLGGVTVNFILAFVIYIGMTYFYGDKYIANNSLKDGVWVTYDVLKNAGMQSGDKIVSVDGEKLERFDQAQNKMLTAKEIVVNRGGEEKIIQLPVDFVKGIVENKDEKLVMPRMPFIVGGFSDDSTNKENLKEKDFLVSVNGEEIKYYDQVEVVLKKYANQSIPANVKRDGVITNISLNVNADGKIGVAPAILNLNDAEKLGLFKLSADQYSLVESIPVGLQMGVDKLVGYGKQLKLIASPETGAYKGVGGFKAIFDVFPQTWSWEAFWSITALLSIMLGVMNLLPIPALDGGHVMFLLYEIISGRKPSDKFMEYAQTVGFVILIALLLFANGNDIYKSIVGN